MKPSSLVNPCKQGYVAQNNVYSGLNLWNPVACIPLHMHILVFLLDSGMLFHYFIIPHFPVSHKQQQDFERIRYIYVSFVGCEIHIKHCIAFVVEPPDKLLVNYCTKAACLPDTFLNFHLFTKSCICAYFLKRSDTHSSPPFVHSFCIPIPKTAITSTTTIVKMMRDVHLSSVAT